MTASKKPKKKRTKKYDPRRHRIGYLDMLDISANKGLQPPASSSTTAFTCSPSERSPRMNRGLI